MELNLVYVKKLNAPMSYIFDLAILLTIAASFFMEQEIQYVGLIIFGLIGLIRLGVMLYNLFTKNDKNKKLDS